MTRRKTSMIRSMRLPPRLGMDRRVMGFIANAFRYLLLNS
jgi:hypothetical protein